MNLILIGMRGAGKSNVSRRLSVLTKYPVLSSDLLISYDYAGKSIADLLAEQSGDWRAFRDMEYKVLKKICRLDGVIVDCGGGAVVDIDKKGNEVYSARKVDLLKKSGAVVWLKGDIKKLAARVKKEDSRPSLDENRSAEEVMRRRLPFYERAADVAVDIDGRSREELADIIFKKFKGKI